MSEVTADEIVLHLKRCGFVDPEDGCVPLFTSTNGEHWHAWTSASRLANALLAQFKISPRADEGKETHD